MDDLTEEYVRQIIIEAFQVKDMAVVIGGCGCCGSPYVEVYHNGKKIFDGDNFTIVRGMNENKLKSQER